MEFENVDDNGSLSRIRLRDEYKRISGVVSILSNFAKRIKGRE
jgi:hypothetical protein